MSNPDEDLITDKLVILANVSSICEQRHHYKGPDCLEEVNVNVIHVSSSPRGIEVVSEQNQKSIPL